MKICWLLILISYMGFAQSNESSRQNTGEHEGIAGNPYFMKDWSNGVIRFSSGKVTDKFKLKFNAAQNRLLLQFSGSTFAAESSINDFVMYTKDKKDSFVFRKGFPDTDRGNAQTFYQILEKGRGTLLRLAAKDIVEKKEIVGSKVSRYYKDVDEFYLFLDGIMHRINKEATAIQDILVDRRPELKNYISEQQLKMRSAEDFIKVVKKYNELQK